jgi:UDP-N-acetylglucosamine:LPS N-acetylglucosamine transferase
LTKAPRVLAVASAGGHFIQLCRLMPALRGCEVAFVTTDPALHVEVASKANECGLGTSSFHVTTEANRWQKARLVRAGIEIALILMKVRPTVVITTGAAPGYLALRLAALIGIRTVWIDSIANAEALSLSGRKAGKHADLWLTQWEHLTQPDGPHYRGSVV